MPEPTSRIDVEGRQLRLTNPSKVLYPVTGTTKADVLRYYLAVAGRLVEWSAMRPATRKRWPNGVGTAEDPVEAFFTKNLENGAPDWLATHTIEHRSRPVRYPLVNDRATLAWLAQVAALEVHVPQWRVSVSGEELYPDRLVLDLDPGPGTGLAECVEVAFTARELLEGMDLSVVPVTSGSKGLHLYAGLEGSRTSDEINAFAKEFARAVESLMPQLVVHEMKKSLREGKVLVDWSQNNGNKTTICPWSLRGQPRPTVAAPRSWDELGEPGLDHLLMDEVLERLADAGADAAGPGTGPGSPPRPPSSSPGQAAGTGRPGHSGPTAPSSGSSGDAGDDRLTTYRGMRDATRTPEPVPPTAPGPAGNQVPTFVIQEHHARRLHWDFRLERDGVLVSWAVPKGPPTDPEQNHLAVHTEDHPLEYGSFEGEIPRGEYGAGHVTIWDAGTIEVEKWREGKEVIVTLYGRPDGGLGGRPAKFALIATHARDEERNWLIHRMRLDTDQDRPEHVDPEHVDPEQEPRSEQQPRPRQQASTQHSADGGAPESGSARIHAEPPPDLLPMLPSPGSLGSMGTEDWAFEMKWDGIRAIATVWSGQVRLTSRNGRVITAVYPELAELVTKVDGDARLDGEIVALDGSGRPSFGLLQQRMNLTRSDEIEAVRARVPAHFMVFDILQHGDESLLMAHWEDRRARLEQVVTEGDHVHTPVWFDGSAHDAIEVSAELGLEGIIGKRRDSVYRPGKRTKTWLKVKHRPSQEVVLVGWRPGQNGHGIGSVLVAVRPETGGPLVYAGRVGTGFNEAQLARLAPRLASIERDTPAAEGVPPDVVRIGRWVEPSLVAEVTYSDRTSAGILRQPVWLGLREDKDPDEVVWE